MNDLAVLTCLLVPATPARDDGPREGGRLLLDDGAHFPSVSMNAMRLLATSSFEPFQYSVFFERPSMNFFAPSFVTIDSSLATAASIRITDGLLPRPV